MKTDSPNLTPLPDAELEARIVAWVAGEASAFEAAELSRLLADNPELAIFKRRIEAVHGLVGEAVRADAQPLRLSPDRRAKLLATLGASQAEAPGRSPAPTTIDPITLRKKQSRQTSYWIYGAAASVAIGFLAIVSQPAYQKVRSASLERTSSGITGRRESAAYADDARERVLKEREYKEASELEEVSELGVKDTYSAPPPSLSLGKVSRSYSVSGGMAAQDSIRVGSMGLAGDKYGFDFRPAELAKKEKAPAPAGAPPASAPPAAPPTLAGQRLNSNLRDVGSAITVVTDDFLKNVGAADNKKLLQYSNGTEVAGTQGNFIPGRKSDGPTAGVSDHVVPGALAAASGAEQRQERDEEVVTLSPFEVAAQEDKGYKARHSQAGAKPSSDGITLEENKQLDAIVDTDPAPAKRPVTPPAQNFGEVNAAKEPVSTFSLHVSDVSFRLAQAALGRGEAPDAATLRPEEFYNAFNYGDPTPLREEKVSCRIEQAAHPFAQQRNLVRIAVKVASSGRDAAQPLHLTVLLDTSGSMEREDRAATVRAALQSLVSLLGPNDRLTLVGFARTPRLLAEAISGDQAAALVEQIGRTPAEGGTNLEAALALGRELALRHFNEAAQNRIVLFTDGAANLGNADPAQLSALVAALRKEHIAFDACGVGLAGLDDTMLESLTRQGDGRYEVLNSPAAAAEGFAQKLAGAFRPAAENVKLQVRFNPARTGRYRLIGFEQHRLREEDFRNDSVDAAELAAEEAAVAVYQVEPLPQGEGELGEVSVRFRDAATGKMVERTWTLAYNASAPAFDRATPSLQLAGTAALLAEKLRGGEAGAGIALPELAPVVTRLRGHYSHEARVQDLATMFAQARRLTGE